MGFKKTDALEPREYLVLPEDCHKEYDEWINVKEITLIKKNLCICFPPKIEKYKKLKNITFRRCSKDEIHILLFLLNEEIKSVYCYSFSYIL